MNVGSALVVIAEKLTAMMLVWRRFAFILDVIQVRMRGWLFDNEWFYLSLYIPYGWIIPHLPCRHRRNHSHGQIVT